MSNDTQNTLPLPSDRTLTTDYVALKPGNYKARTDLTPYKGKNLTNNQILDYKPESPFGIGDALSVVYVYPQGTIEIIGNVYCWNKLVKPGIYSQFEKIRYLNNEVVLPRVESNVFQHHASYDKTIRVPNRFVSKNSNHAEPIIQYHYVDFNDQIVSTNGDKVYPIPVLGGTLTLYPDGTFKTEGVVVKSTDSTLVDEYGYLGDDNDYGTINLFYNDITKDDVNPKNIYKVISENEDGSTTYGAINLNKHLVRDSWITLPPGIIPVNDGKVSIATDGLMTIDGTVITDKGHLILPGTVYYRELFTKDKEGNLTPNPNMIDTSVVYNPRIDMIGDLDWGKVVLAIADGNKSIYEYHMDNYQVIRSEEGPTVLYLPMDGWDTFTSNKANPRYNMAFLSKFIDASLVENKDKYPWYGGQVKIGGFYLTGKVRPFPKTKSFKYYPIFDHRCFWNPDNISGEPIPYDRVIYLNKEAFETRKQEWLIQYDKLGNEIDNTFVPYRSLKHTDEISSVRLANTNIETSGTVVWKRNDQYYSIFGNNQAELNTDWPDIKEYQGSYLELFTPLGYFKDEPIFISREGDGTDPHGNYEDSFDGIRRQEPGVFNIVTRNITHYLTSLEKALIDNYYKENIIIVGDYNTLDFDVKHYHRLESTSDINRSKLTLEYHAYRYAEVYPSMLSIKNTLFASRDVLTDLLRVYRYTRDEEMTSPYWDVASIGSQFNGEHYFYSLRNKALSVKEKGNTRLTRARPNPNTFKDYHNVEFNDNHWGYYEEPNFNVTERVILEDSVPTVVALNGNNIQYFYHASNDLKYITGSFTLSRNETFTIPITLENKYGYIDVWYDDPFDEYTDKNHINPNVKRIKLRKDKSVTELKLLSLGEITTSNENIVGVGEPRAMLTIVDINDPDVIILSKRVDNDGSWSINDLSGLIPGHTYRLTQTDEFGFSSSITFTIKQGDYKLGDYLTPKQLFGRDVYLYPVNLRNINNGAGIPNLIDSSITFNVKMKTYSVNGLLVDANGNIYKEGTYPFGTLPNSYQASGITVDDINAVTLSPQVRHKGADSYQLSRQGYTANSTLNIGVTSLSSSDIVNNEWIIAREWINNGRTYLETLSSDEYIARHGTEFTLDEMKLLINNFDSYISNPKSDIRIGRYQNKLTIDIPFPRIVNDSETLVYYIHLENDKYNKEGYSFVDFISLLKRTPVWWETVTTPLSNTRTYSLSLSTLFNTVTKENYSYTLPDMDVYTPKVLTKDSNVSINNGKVITPEHYSINDNITIYQFNHWNRLISADDNDNSLFKWVYTLSFGYRLTGNYDNTSNKMSDNTLSHWTTLGYPPSMFVFDEHTLGHVEYMDNGRDVIIQGRVKVGGRYTRNLRQSAIPKSGIQFLSYCPNAYVPADNTGRVYINEDDSITIEGNVEYRHVNSQCEYVTLPSLDINEMMIDSCVTRSKSGDIARRVENDPDGGELIIVINHVNEYDIPDFKINIGISPFYINFGKAYREYQKTTPDQYIGFSYDESGLADNEMSEGGNPIPHTRWIPINETGITHVFEKQYENSGNNFGKLTITIDYSVFGNPPLPYYNNYSSLETLSGYVVKYVNNTIGASTNIGFCYCNIAVLLDKGGYNTLIVKSPIIARLAYTGPK